MDFTCNTSTNPKAPTTRKTRSVTVAVAVAAAAAAAAAASVSSVVGESSGGTAGTAKVKSLVVGINCIGCNIIGRTAIYITGGGAIRTSGHRNCVGPGTRGGNHRVSGSGYTGG